MRRRTHRHVFYLNDAEEAHFERQTALSGLTDSALIRRQLGGLDIRPRPPDELPQVLRELHAIGNNVNQLARHANAGGYVSGRALNEVRDELRAILNEVKRL